MPTYEYECKSCGHRFELFQKLTDPPSKACPRCHKNQATRRIAAPGFILKGPGFYKTDSKGGAVSSTGDKTKKEPKKKKD